MKPSSRLTDEMNLITGESEIGEKYQLGLSFCNYHAYRSTREVQPCDK